MLGPAEASIVARDPQLPGLRLLLDEQRLADWVSEQLGRPTLVRRRHLRYKPGTSCVVHLDAGGRPLLVSARRRDEVAKDDKTRERAAAGSLVGAHTGLGVLAGSPIIDRDLPGVALLADRERRTRLLARWPVAEIADPDLEPVLLRYKPHRRWVGVLPGRDGRGLLLRVHRPAVTAGAAAALLALQGTGVDVPRMVGQSRRRGVLAVEFVPGRTVHDAGPAGYEAAGAALAGLHRLGGDGLPKARVGADEQSVRAAAEHLGLLLPEVAQRADRLAHRIIARMPAASAASADDVPVHGDFSADQVVVAPDGRITLIDLDSACLGAPGADLGCAAAALARDEALGRLTASEHDAALASLHEGYRDAGGPATSEPVAVHTGAHLLRRAVEPFRLGLTPAWPDAALDLLVRAEAALDHGIGGGR